MLCSTPHVTIAARAAEKIWFLEDENLQVDQSEAALYLVGMVAINRPPCSTLAVT
jgi:hypothetical protein